MCDYSLHSVNSRRAQKNDKLIVTALSKTTKGFAAVGQLDTAVCLMPGMKVLFELPAQGMKRFPWSRRKFGLEAQFVQINQRVAGTHHDALLFEDGAVVLITNLVSGQYATVTEVPKTEAQIRDEIIAEQEAARQRRIARQVEDLMPTATAPAPANTSREKALT